MKLQLEKKALSIGIVVPVTDNDGAKIDINRYRKILIDFIGGYTETNTAGGWIDKKTDKIYIDNSISFKASFNSDNIDKPIKALALLIKNLMIDKEKTICFSINNIDYFIDNQPCTIKELMKNIKPLIFER